MPEKRHWFFDSYKYQVRAGTVPEYADGYVIRTHSHPWHQLVYASRGVMTVRTPEGAWVVPIHRAVWVPAGTRHSIEMSGPVSLRTLYLVPRLSHALPAKCRVIGISPLLRELILCIVELDSLSLRVPAHAHLVSVLLDHLHVMQSDAVHLPLPRDARAKRIAAMLQSNRPTVDRSPNCRSSRAPASAPSSGCSSSKPVWASANGVSNSGLVTRCDCSLPANPSRRSRWRSATTASARSFRRFA